MTQPVKVSIAVEITSGAKTYSMDEFNAEIDLLKSKIESLGSSFEFLNFDNLAVKGEAIRGHNANILQ